MINPAIADYLRQGRAQGYDVEVLKQQLVQAGYDPLAVEEAAAGFSSVAASEAPDSSFEGISSLPGKIGLSFTSLRTLFQATGEEKFLAVVKYHFVTLAVAFVFAAIILSAIELGFAIELREFLGTRRSAATADVLGVLLGLFAIFYFALVPLFMFITAYIWHSISKPLGGSGNVKSAYKAVVYGSTPFLLLSWLPGVNLLAFLYSLYAEVQGMAINHKTTLLKAALSGIVTYGILAAISYILWINTLQQWFT